MRLLVGVTLWMLTASGLAEPTRFKTLELGATWDQIYAVHPFLTCQPPYADGKRECVVAHRGARNYPLEALTTIGDLRIELRLVFYDSRLMSVQFAIPSARFSEIRDAMREKLGAPSSSVVDQRTNGIVTVDSQILTWGRPDATIFAWEQIGRLGTGAIAYVHDGLSRQRRQEQKPKASDF